MSAAELLPGEAVDFGAQKRAAKKPTAKAASKPKKVAKAKPKDRFCPRCGRKIWHEETFAWCSSCVGDRKSLASRVLLTLLNAADIGPKPERIKALCELSYVYADAMHEAGGLPDGMTEGDRQIKEEEGAR